MHEQGNGKVGHAAPRRRGAGCREAQRLPKSTAAGTRILIAGGSASEKSAFAEEMALRGETPRIYLATMEPEGPEAQERIARHRRLREGKGFITVEMPRAIGSAPFPLDGPQATNRTSLPDERLSVKGHHARARAITPQGTLLIECLGTLLANEMFPPDGPMLCGPEPADRILSDIRALGMRFRNMVVVTNDVGRSVDEFSPATRCYLWQLGRLGNLIAAEFDTVVEVVAGQPLVVKGAL